MLVLIGGDGFLGRHLRAALAAQGRPGATIVSRRNLAPAYGGETTLTPDAYPQAMASARGPCTIVYLASTSVPATNAHEPWREFESNVVPLFRYLDPAARDGLDVKVIFLSSGGTVYGNTGIAGPVPETTPLAPISPYGLGKAWAEDTVSFFRRRHGFRTHILRVANPIGRHQVSSVQGIVPALFRAAQHALPFPLFGSSDSVRDYIDANDVADAILAAADDTAHPAATWNVGSGIGRTVADLIDIVADITGHRVQVERKPARPTDVGRIVLDNRRIREDLGWRPTRDIVETVREMWHEWERRAA